MMLMKKKTINREVSIPGHFPIVALEFWTHAW